MDQALKIFEIKSNLREAQNMKKRIKPKAPPVFLFNFVMKFTNFLKKLRFKILPPQATSVGGLHHKYIWKDAA